jgi:hypothetical protein
MEQTKLGNTEMNTIYSPSNIELLIWCHVRFEPHPRMEAPGVAETLKEFLDMGVIRTTPEPNVFTTTPLGAAWVESLCNTPPPRLAYIDQLGKIIKST